jgi:hypothetical protein
VGEGYRTYAANVGKCENTKSIRGGLLNGLVTRHGGDAQQLHMGVVPRQHYCHSVVMSCPSYWSARYHGHHLRLFFSRVGTGIAIKPNLRPLHVHYAGGANKGKRDTKEKKLEKPSV